MTFTVAIIGRPNVGKSTLFNRLVGKRLALVDDTPGVTRDRRDAKASLGELKFRIIDTAGLEDETGDSLSARMRKQTELAIEEADFSMFMIDARAGVTPLDKHFADILRRNKKQTILVANKSEGKAGTSGLYESYTLGLGDPVPLSAEHGEGLADLSDAFDEALRELGIDPFANPEEEVTAKSVIIEGEVSEEDELLSEQDDGLPMQIAIVGRPNAGKSTLINKILGEDRMLTGPEAGITRDSIGVNYTFEGRELRIFDTAGMRRKSRVQEKLEKLSVADTIRALNFAEIVILMVDATQPF
jgi:GTP-binding protein